jgi:hypothetical protein
MPETDPLAVERFRTILTDAIRDTGYDAYAMGADAAPETAAVMLLGKFPDAHFARRVNEHGVAVRRVVVASEWENDPNPAQEPQAGSAWADPHEFVGTRVRGRDIDSCSHVSLIGRGLGVMCHAGANDPIHTAAVEHPQPDGAVYKVRG